MALDIIYPIILTPIAFAVGYGSLRKGFRRRFCQHHWSRLRPWACIATTGATWTGSIGSSRPKFLSVIFPTGSDVGSSWCSAGSNCSQTVARGNAKIPVFATASVSAVTRVLVLCLRNPDGKLAVCTTTIRAKDELPHARFGRGNAWFSGGKFVWRYWRSFWVADRRNSWWSRGSIALTYWCDNSAVWTHYGNASSIIFPAWEKAFAAVINHHLPSVKNEDLRRRMIKFVQEEMSHASAHESFNDRHNLKDAEKQEFANTKIIHRLDFDTFF